MGDADCYTEAFNQAVGIVDENSLSCFNHPANVSRLRRDSLEELYGHINGLIIPTCISLEPSDISEFDFFVKKINSSIRLFADWQGPMEDRRRS
jgi:hypothetical protein